MHLMQACSLPGQRVLYPHRNQPCYCTGCYGGKQGKGERRKKVILFNLSGHGLLDLGSYEKYFANELDNYTLTDDELAKSEAVFKDFPKPQPLKSI
jgi:hypothetical protein